MINLKEAFNHKKTKQFGLLCVYVVYVYAELKWKTWKKLNADNTECFLSNLKAEMMNASINLLLHAWSRHHIYLRVCMNKRFIIPYYLSLILYIKWNIRQESSQSLQNAYGAIDSFLCLPKSWQLCVYPVAYSLPLNASRLCCRFSAKTGVDYGTGGWLVNGKLSSLARNFANVNTKAL